MSNDPVEKAILKARVKLLWEQPLFGHMIMHLETQDASAWCMTAATDGEHLFYNREFIKSLVMDELVFLFAHEVMHCILFHMFRRGDRNAAVWNMAIDYISNYTLVQSKIGKMPKGGLYNAHYTDEFSSEELYSLLMSREVPIESPMDQHLDANGAKENEGETDSGDLFGQGPPTVSADKVEQIRDRLRAALVQAAQNTSAGQIPGGVQRLLNRLLKPKIDWRQMLVSVLRSTIKYDYTYTRLSRRTWSSGLLLPGQDVMDRVDAVAWLDGSGSTTQEMVTDFLRECKGIMGAFRDFKLTVGTFDTQAYNVREFTPRNAADIDKYDFIGGGGTMPSCCWDYMKENQIHPNRLVIFTDGHVNGDWGEPGYADTLFIVHSNPQIVAPYGRTVAYDP